VPDFFLRKEYLPEHISMEQMNNNFLPLSIMPIILLLLIPALFQRLCQSSGLATGPQCQGLLQGQQPSTTTGTTTAAGTCPTGFVIQNNFCVPATSTTSYTMSRV